MFSRIAAPNGLLKADDVGDVLSRYPWLPVPALASHADGLFMSRIRMYCALVSATTKYRPLDETAIVLAVLRPGSAIGGKTHVLPEIMHETSKIFHMIIDEGHEVEFIVGARSREKKAGPCIRVAVGPYSEMFVMRKGLFADVLC